MENRIEALETKLKKVADEVQRIPAMEKNITALVEEISQLLIRLEATETLVQKMQEKKEQQSKSTEAKRRGGEQQQQRLPVTLALRMLEFPLFNGTDSLRWISKMELYFEFHGMDDFARMMEIIARCMSGEALDWFRCVQNWKNPPGSWDEFRRALFMRFEGGYTMYDRFIALQQEGSVRDYCSQFELLRALLPDIPDCLLEAKFMNGLKTVIRAEVRVFQPKGILEIMEKARLVEDRNNVALNLAVGDTSCNTMKFKGTINERPVVVKIDSGETHNFISQNLATELNLPLDHCGISSVVLGSGKTIKGDEICRGVLLRIQNYAFSEDFLPLEIEGDSEVILGMPWLGGTEVDWKALTMKVKVGRRTLTLRGDPSL